ncbi:hypothetical protein D3C76_978860 [compost metagenome]
MAAVVKMQLSHRSRSLKCLIQCPFPQRMIEPIGMRQHVGLLPPAYQLVAARFDTGHGWLCQRESMVHGIELRPVMQRIERHRPKPTANPIQSRLSLIQLQAQTLMHVLVEMLDQLTLGFTELVVNIGFKLALQRLEG